MTLHESLEMVTLGVGAALVIAFGIWIADLARRRRALRLEFAVPRRQYHPAHAKGDQLSQLRDEMNQTGTSSASVFEHRRERLPSESERTAQLRALRDDCPECGKDHIGDCADVFTRPVTAAFSPPGTDAGEDFFEEDEPVADVIAAYERGVKCVTAPPDGYVTGQVVAVPSPARDSGILRKMAEIEHEWHWVAGKLYPPVSVTQKLPDGDWLRALLDAEGVPA